MNNEPVLHKYKGFEIHRSEGQYPTYSMDCSSAHLSGVKTLKEVKSFIDLVLSARETRSRE